MAFIWKCFWIFSLLVIEGVKSYEVCRRIEDITVTYCDDGYYCCGDDTRCCTNDELSPVGIVALVIGCIIGIAFIVVAIILCIKRNNFNKPQGDDTGTPYPEIDIVYTGNMSFPPPYIESSDTPYPAFELQNYIIQPPPYQSSDSAADPSQNSADVECGNERAQVDDVCVSGSANEAFDLNDESPSDSSKTTKKMKEGHMPLEEDKAEGSACFQDIYVDTEQENINEKSEIKTSTDAAIE